VNATGIALLRQINTNGANVFPDGSVQVDMVTVAGPTSDETQAAVYRLIVSGHLFVLGRSVCLTARGHDAMMAVY
jgi:hypothetical protein